MYLIILGPPGVGKGTQSTLIADKLGLKHLSTGEILRNAVEDKTELGIKAKEVMDKGYLVSDEIMIGIIKDALSTDELKKGFILDGFPRTKEQAKALDNILSELNYKELVIINLTADNNELIKRMAARGRKDDSAETIKHRLKVYKEQTSEVKQHYAKIYDVIEVNGLGDIEKINELILDELNKAS